MSQHSRRPTLIALAVLLAVPVSYGDADFYTQLSAPCRIFGQGIPARDLLRRIETGSMLTIWLDRRLDPSTRIDLPPTNRKIEDALSLIADQLDGEIGFTGDAVIIAPVGTAVNAASAVLDLRHQMATSSSRGALQRQTLHWDRLATPAEIRQQIAQRWSIRIAGDALPHDLWAEQAYQDVDGITALVFLAEGFGLLPVYDSQQRVLQLVPIDGTVRAEVRYPNAKVTTAILSRLRSLDAGMESHERDRWTYIKATATAHHDFQKRSQTRSRPKVSAPNPMAKQFRAVMKPAIAILKTLAVALEMELDEGQASASRLQQRVSIEVKEMAIKEIMVAVCEKTGLTIEFSDGRAVLADAD